MPQYEPVIKQNLFPNFFITMILHVEKSSWSVPTVNKKNSSFRMNFTDQTEISKLDSSDRT